MQFEFVLYVDHLRRDAFDDEGLFLILHFVNLGYRSMRASTSMEDTLSNIFDHQSSHLVVPPFQLDLSYLVICRVAQNIDSEWRELFAAKLDTIFLELCGK